MKIQEVIKNNVAVMSLAGKLMGGEHTEQVHEHVKNLIQRGYHHVVIDLAELQWLNSSGMGILIASLTSLRKENGNLVLANVNTKVSSLLQMMHLHLVFDKFESVGEAVEHFEKSAAT
jgi:anti-sigma B factor antagonist